MLSKIEEFLAVATLGSMCLLAANQASAQGISPSNACSSLDDGSKLPWCSTNSIETGDTSVDCPAMDRWVVLIDHDAATAEATAKNSNAQNTSWSEMLNWLRLIDRISCRTGASDPLAALPKSCETIQRLGAGSRSLGPCRKGSTLFPLFLGSAGPTTPAVEAVAWAAKELKESRQDLILIAFDGVVDGDYDRRSPPDDFAIKVAEFIKTGATAAVVARPQEFRYVYIFARQPFAAYTAQLAEGLAKLWNSGQSDGPPAFALALTSESLLAPGRRSATAKAQVNGLPISGHPSWRFGEVPLYREKKAPAYWVDPLRWLKQDQPAGVAFQLKWNTHPEDWFKEGSAGLLQSPPELHTHYPMTKALPAVSSWTTDGTVVVKELKDCAAQPTRRAPLLQDAHVTAGHVDLLLFRGRQSSLAWLRDWRSTVIPRPAAGATEPQPVDPLCTVGTDEYRRTFTGAEDGAAANLALVAPGPALNPCISKLKGLLSNSHLWLPSQWPAKEIGSLATSPECSAASLKSLVTALAATKSRPFKTNSSTYATVRDARTGMETLVLTIAAAAEATLQRIATHPEAKPCILATLRVNDTDWRPGPESPDLQSALPIANPCRRQR